MVVMAMTLLATPSATAQWEDYYPITLDPSCGWDTNYGNYVYMYDDSEYYTSLPFSFSLWGMNHNYITIADNGWAKFSYDSYMTWSNYITNYQYYSDADLAVMPWWDDLVPYGGGATYVYKDSSVMRVTWLDRQAYYAYWWGDYTNFDIQLSIYPDGHMTFAYGDITPLQDYYYASPTVAIAYQNNFEGTLYYGYNYAGVFGTPVNPGDCLYVGEFERDPGVDLSVDISENVHEALADYDTINMALEVTQNNADDVASFDYSISSMAPTFPDASGTWTANPGWTCGETDFETSYGVWPAGWTEPVGGAWNNEYGPYGDLVAVLAYWHTQPYGPYGIGPHVLQSPVMDCSGSSGTMFEYNLYWFSGYPGGDQSLTIEGTTDNWATSHTIGSYSYANPTSFDDDVVVPIPWADGQSNVQFRFTGYEYDDWYMVINDVFVGKHAESLGGGDTVKIYVSWTPGLADTSLPGPEVWSVSGTALHPDDLDTSNNDITVDKTIHYPPILENQGGSFCEYGMPGSAFVAQAAMTNVGGWYAVLDDLDMPAIPRILEPLYKSGATLLYNGDTGKITSVLVVPAGTPEATYDVTVTFHFSTFTAGTVYVNAFASSYEVDWKMNDGKLSHYRHCRNFMVKLRTLDRNIDSGLVTNADAMSLGYASAADGLEQVTEAFIGGDLGKTGVNKLNAFGLGQGGWGLGLGQDGPEGNGKGGER
jgi:hypothetical protein